MYTVLQTQKNMTLTGERFLQYNIYNLSDCPSLLTLEFKITNYSASHLILPPTYSSASTELPAPVCYEI